MSSHRMSGYSRVAWHPAATLPLPNARAAPKRRCCSPGALVWTRAIGRLAYTVVLSCGMLLGPSLPAQHQTTASLTGGPLAQGSPTTSESGYTIGANLSAWPLGWLGLVVGADIARVAVQTQLLVCHVIGPSRECLTRPREESAASMSGMLELSPFAHHMFRPRAGAGLALSRSLAPRNPGEEQQFTSVQFQGGFEAGHAPSLSVDVRLREFNRWSGRNQNAQIALLLGFGF